MVETLETLNFSNGYEASSRRDKAEVIATVLHAWGVGSDVVAHMNEEQWELARKAAEAFRREHNGDTRKMSTPSQECRDMVLEILREREDAALQRLEYSHGN